MVCPDLKSIALFTPEQFTNQYRSIVNSKHQLLIQDIYPKIPNLDVLLLNEENIAVSVISGERVADLRKRKGWSQHELARHAGVTAPVISRMERNLQEDFDFFVILGVARSLGVPIESLLSDVPPSDMAVIPELQRALYRLQQAPHEVQRHLARIIEVYLDTL